MLQSSPFTFLEARIMVSLPALWLPTVGSAVFVFIALMLMHGLLGWHKDDLIAVPGEAQFLDAVRALTVAPGDYRFPHAYTTKEMTTPEFEAKMALGPVGVMSVWPRCSA
jgi:hypothetical protein